MAQNAGERFGIHAAGQRVSGEGVPEIVGGFLTDYLGEEMAPWQNAENTATAVSA